MNLKSRLNWLQEQHKMLDRKIDDITKHTITHTEDVADLKKKRLQYRDEIATIQKQLHEETHERLDWNE
jgi:hypothetical protein